MTHDELLAKINKEVEAAEFESACGDGNNPRVAKALRAVVELHKPDDVKYTNRCSVCYYRVGYREFMFYTYPCPTVQAIEKELG